ncbi:DNA repair protein Mus7 [Histoplasma capsulatum]|uniref:DNA repair protein Mus7 n=2 Tax=Histoplasma TaxID=5036 RepID=A0A8A1M5Q7_AJECA|nr:DNA repair protein Mus7 [Histoplasma capsulatum]
MELWRERGFVPDSDEEDDFESQQSNKLSEKNGNTSTPGIRGEDEIGNAGVQGNHRDRVQDGQVIFPASGNELFERQPTKRLGGEAGKIMEPDTHRDELIPKDLNPAGDQDQEQKEESPESHVGPDEFGNAFYAGDELDEDPLQCDDGLNKFASRIELPSTTTGNTTPSSDAIRRLSSSTDRSSSPDELQFDEHFPPRTPATKDSQSNNLKGDVGDYSEDSSLSPAPSNPQTPPSFRNQGAGRTLRGRKFINLHPYLADQVEYQRWCASNNIRPVRIAPADRDSNPQDESQGQEFVDENAPPSSSPAAPFRFPPGSPSAGSKRKKLTQPARPLRESPQTGNSRNGPMHWRSAKSQQLSTIDGQDSARKRRKIMRTYGNAPGNESEETRKHQIQVVVDNRVMETPPLEDEGIFDVPLSSPSFRRTSPNNRVQKPAIFRFPRGYSLSPPRSPISHKPQSPRNSDAILADDSLHVDFETHPKIGGNANSQSQPPLSMEEVDVEQIHPPEETEDLEESEYHAALEIQRLRRRIKGVLPASWPRLDLKQQQEREKAAAEKARLSYLRNRRQSGKGVARRITRDRSDSHNQGMRQKTLFISDESTSDDEPTYAVQSSREILSEVIDKDDLFVGDVADDIPEDNRIDYMLPPAPRKGKRRTLGSNRQNRSRFQTSSNSRKRPLHQARITDTLTRLRTSAELPETRLPRLGVLDVADVQDQPMQKQPQFLRVAARQARSRRDRGRKSPTRTYLKLGTSRDTEDANRSLAEWRAGLLQQSKMTGSHATKISRQTCTNSVASHNHVEANENRVHQVRTGTVYPMPRSDVDARSPKSDLIRPTLELRPTAQQEGANPSSPPHSRRKVGQRWAIRKGGYAISSLRRNAPRPAQLDIPMSSSHSLGHASSFQRSLSALNSLYQTTTSRLGRNTGLPLARFLTENMHPQNIRLATSNENSNARDDVVPSAEKGQIRRPRQRRKLPPQHVNVEDSVENPQAVSVDNHVAEIPSITSIESSEHPPLKGLKSPSTMYTINFDIFPLPVGTFFHSSTFIGSGDLSRSMKLSSRNLSHDNGRSVIQHADQTYQWGPWNETVSSELGVLLDTVLEAASNSEPSSERIAPDSSSKLSRSLDIFRSIITYVNDKLYFMDSVDRSMFVDRCIVLLSKVSDMLPFSITNSRSDSTTTPHHPLKLEVFTYVFANQIRQIASNGLVQSIKYFEIVSIMTTIQNRILQAVLSKTGLADIRQFLDDVKWREKREPGIKDDHPFLEAFLVVQKIFYTDRILRGTNQDLLSQAVLPPSSSPAPNDSHELEKLWHGVFMTLPLYEFDELGIFHPGQRFKDTFDQWETIKRLIVPVFETYSLPSKRSSLAFNNYCRALFHRCFYLIDSWGWRHSKVILDTLFDFFAKNWLYNLNQEQSLGSPKFLDELDRQPRLEMEPKDSCFHILLKTIALGLKKMTDLYDRKKIRNFAWRLLPNHGREYPKDQPLRLEELEALRNHHDLLCTLYWATPDTCRPRVETIRNLVHPATAHKEVCSINIRSWLRLVKFKLSTDEDIAGLIPFADWHASFVADMLQQHSHARTDVDAQVASNSLFSRQIVEKAVIEYQKPIECLLSDALVNLKIAIDATTTADQSKILLEKLPFSKLLELFNPRIARFHSLICKALDVVVAYASTTIKSRRLAGPAETCDDSQEFEGWAVLAELYEQEETAAEANPPVEYLNNIIRPSLSRFLSTCYGEDQAPDDIVLLKVVDSWSSIAYTLVNNGLREWSSYVNPYGEDSWASLRATHQTRKFLPYFLASLIEKDTAFYTECQYQILNHWIECIVERGSMLKYQHSLTNAIMNTDASSALLKNLPFSKSSLKCRYEITLQEFSQRRLSLISCILSNMREHLSDAEDISAHAVQNTRSRYRRLIETLMNTMKSNYNELGNVDSSVHSSYVNFVHGVVAFLQQHSQKICLLDPFFTNPSTFPLPVNDPNYIVGKLKSYAVRLTSSKVANELFTFLQHVSERAAVDGQQTYLVDQLYSVMAETFETNERHQSTIRLFMLHCVLPAYLEICLIAPGAWILVRPLLQSLTRMLMDSILFINTCDINNVSTFVGPMVCYFEAVDNALRLLVDHPGLLDEPHIILTVISLLETVITSLPAIDYLYRISISDQATTLVAYVDIFKQFILFATSTLLNPADAVAPQTLDMVLIEDTQKINDYPSPPPFFSDARDFATRGLQSRFQDGWTFHNGKYFVRPEHTHQVKEVFVNDPAYTSIDIAKEAFIKTVEIYFGTMERLMTFSS